MQRKRENVLSADNQQGRLDMKKLSADYIVGFVDGEGSFHIAIYQDPRMKVGVKFIPEFHVSQRVTSRAVLDALVPSLGCGYVKANHAKNPWDTTYVYIVRDRDDLLKKVIPFFRNHLLQTEKAKDFSLFATIVQKMADGYHLDKIGARALLKMAYRMNQNGRYRKKLHHI